MPGRSRPHIIFVIFLKHNVFIYLHIPTRLIGYYNQCRVTIFISAHISKKVQH